MFDFQKEVIINSNVLEDGVTPRFKAMTGAVNLFRVLRCADYRKEGLIDGIVYKTMYNKGAAPSATFDVPTVAGIYRVIVGFSLDGRYLSDYAYPWYKFGKPVMAEFELDDSNLAEAQEIMIKAIEMAIPENYRFARITKEGSDKVKVSGTDSHQIIKVAELQKVVSLACPADACHEVEYQLVAKAVVEKNIMEVGTAAWIQENLRFPSYPNLRYDALNEEEYPVKGGLYVQYSFGYCSPRRGLHGQGTVNIPDTLFKITILNDANLTVAYIDAGKVSIKQTISGPAISGDVVKDVKYAVENADSKYEIGTDGLLSVASGKTAEVGDVLKVLVSYYGSEASKEFTVIA